MKKLIYISLFLTIATFSGCSGFLDTEPLSFTTPSNFYKDVNDFETALTGCYGQLGQSYAVNYRTGMFLLANVGTDELLGNPYSTPDPESNMDQFISGRVVKSNRNVRDLWEKMYTGLYAIDDLLHNLDKIDMDENRRLAIRSEAMFLRGWHYMYLGMIFGGVPVFNSVPHVADKGRDRLEVVMNQAISDLEFAYENLQATENVEITRANKWAAAGYLARLYCYLASAKKYNVGADLGFELNSFQWVNVDQSYDSALQLINQIENNSSFKLTEDYRHLFVEGSMAKQKEEILFSLAPSPEKKIGFGLMYYLLPVGSQGGGWGTCRPTQEVLNRYNRPMDSRALWVVGGLADEDIGAEEIDGKTYNKHKALTINESGEAWDGDYNVTKFRYLRTSTKHDDVYYGYFPLLRFAEIILLKAEAVAHKSGVDQGRAVLKPLRERALVKSAGYQADDLQSLYARTDFVTELLEERSRELCFEHYRRFDLIRFNRYASTIRAISATYGVWNRNAARQLIDNISDERIWCPIPEEDEIANPNLVPNNPGY